ncbi:DHA2 family efflux MFS transporter permease subunit [Aurantivibrio infirmus]
MADEPGPSSNHSSSSTFVDEHPSSAFNNKQRVLITLSVMLATIMQAIDTTIANVALPQMQGSMGVFQDQISWVLTSYILASAIFIPLTGFLSGRFGRRRVFITAVIGFTLTSMLCGAAQDIYQIVIFRFIQGVFGAPLIPLSQSIMLDIYPKEKHGSAMAAWGMGVMLGPIIGPTLGGWLTEYFTWRAVFYINLPIGLLTWLGLTMFVKETAVDKKKHFDGMGFFYLAIAIGALQMMLDRGNSLNWFDSGEIVIEGLMSLLFFYLFLSHTFLTDQPFIDPRMFADKNFVVGIGFMFVVGVILMTVMTLLPPFMEGLMGYPILDVGILLAPRGLGTMISMMIMGRVISKTDPRIYIFIGLAAIMVSLWQMSRFTHEVDSTAIFTTGFLQGLGLGCIFVPLSTLTFSTLEAKFRNEATSLYNLIRNLGSSIGVSVVITLLSRNTQSNHAVFVEDLNFSNIGLRQAVEAGSVDLSTVQGLAALNGGVSQQAFLLAYLQDFRFIMWLCVFVFPFLLLLRPPKAQT